MFTDYRLPTIFVFLYHCAQMKTIYITINLLRLLSSECKNAFILSILKILCGMNEMFYVIEIVSVE